jgi:MFS family permease
MGNKRLKIVLRALRHRNYRLFFIGQGISLVGTWMQSIAVSWLIYRLTHSEFMLGLVAFAGQIPILVLSPFAGVLGDRISRHRILIIVQILAMTQSFILAGITLTGSIQVWQIGLLSLFLGIINAFDMPSRQAFVIEMIGDKADLGNAIALNSAIFNGARLVGPMTAGFLVAFAGEGVCFILNGLSYLAALTAFLRMHIPVRKTLQKGERIFLHMKEGLAYVLGFSPIRDLLITVSFISLVAFSFPVLLPVFASHILQGSSLTYGFLAASWGVGALIGTIFLASRKSVLGLGRVINVSLFISGIGLVLFSFSKWFVLSLAVLAATGFGMIATLASCNTIVQTIVAEEKRGRVMSFYVMALMGSAPFGSFIFGSVSSAIGAPFTVLAGGVLCIAIAFVVALRLPSFRKIVRPIYRGMGIIPEVAIGIQTADEMRKPPE